MSTPTIWYYGDQKITGNYTQNQNFTLAGSSFQTSNITATTTTSNIGTPAVPWYTVYTNSANVSVLNVTSIVTMNINTLSGTGTLYISNILGNLYTSNSVTAQSINAASMNAGTLSIVSYAQNLGIGTTVAPPSTLFVGGNLFASNAMTTQNIWVTNINSASLTTTSLVFSTGIIGGTLANLYTLGNAIFTNSLTTANIFATSLNISTNVTTINLTTVGLFSNINTSSINTSSLVAGTLSIGTYDPFTTLNVTGNAYVSNAVSTTNIFAGQVSVTGISNIGAISGPVGINTTGNIYASNSLTAANVFADNLNGGLMNTYSLIVAAARNFDAFYFTPMGATGALGPTSINYPVLPVGGLSLSAGIQYWRVPASGFYSFVVAGAGSSSPNSFNSVKTGYGAVITGTYTLSEGTIIAILVGQKGSYSGYMSSGGGGTFVAIVSGVGVLNTAIPLFVAGGAGGIGRESDSGSNDNVNASLTTSGRNGGPAGAAPNYAGSGGSGGSGATNAINYLTSFTDGGAGFSGNGCLNSGNPPGDILLVAKSFTNGGTGDQNTGTAGGFGGGGGGKVGLSDYYCGCGGGGYSGGGAGGTNSRGAGGGGGGSYDVTNPGGGYAATGAATNSEDGYVIINSYRLGTLFRGNAYVSNALTTPNVYATTANITTMNTQIISTPTLFSTNVYASNSMTVTNVFASFVNFPLNTSGTLLIPTALGIGTATLQVTPLYVVGNIYASNSLTVNNVYVSGTLNASTINAFTIISTSNVGIGTTPQTTNLYVQGNVYVSGNLFTSNISSPTIYYGEDISTRGPYLTPNAANGPIIQAWISATCNASSQPIRSWWSTSATPVFGNVVTGTSGFQGGVLIPGERIVLVPGTNSSVGFYTPKTLTFEKVIIPTPNESFSGGVLLPTGNVVFCPQTSNIGIFNPLSFAFSNGASLSGGQYSGVLTANNVIFAPKGVPSNLISWNYTTGVAKNVWALSSASQTALAQGSGAMNSARFWTAATWSPQLGLFVAIAGGPGTSVMNYSTDGKTWLEGAMNSSRGWTSLAWSPQLGLFVAFSRLQATAEMNYSTDGKTWLPGTGMTNQDWNSVAWSPQLGLFVAVGGTISETNYSTDGKTWLQGAMNSSQNWKAVAWSPQLGLFVAIATGTTVMNYSTNGKTWLAGAMDTSRNWDSLAWSPQLGLFVAVASTGGISNYSTDGKTWLPGGSLSGGSFFYGVTWMPELGLFVAGEFSSGRVNYSTDGKIWAATVPLGTGGWNTITWSPQLGLLVTISGDAGSGATYYRQFARLQQGACLLPNGNLITPSPGKANVIQFDPVSLAASNIIVGTDGFNSLILAPNGNVIGTPLNSNILVINPSTFTASTVPIPQSNVNCPSFFNAGCLTPSGNIIFAPSLTLTANVGSSNVGMFDPGALTFSNSTSIGSSFTSATLVQSGQVIFGGANVGIYDTMTPVSTEFCMSPYFNKF